MCYYYYDKTFLGFLSLVYEIFRNKIWDVVVLGENENSLFSGELIVTNLENANKVYNKLLKTIGKTNVNDMYYTFLSEESGIEVVLINYIRLGLKYKYAVSKHLTPEVLKVEKLSKKVSHEAHKFLGLLRFRRLLDDTYLAIIDPNHDILSIILPHFTDRFADQNFVIYDEKRKKAILYDCSLKEARIKKIYDFDERLFDLRNFELMHKEEKEYISLWKKYFESIAIEDRKNEKLQKSHMSGKYWKNLVEVN